MSGMRKCLHDEFNHLYIFNLRGDQRTQGETSRKEGGKIFGSGSRTPIAISILVKDGSDNHDIHYYDIGDYLSREEKLSTIAKSDIFNRLNWKTITPDKNNDWINQRDVHYDKYTPMDGGVFLDKSIGVSTSRDSWVYGFNKDKVQNNVKKLIKNYNFELKRLGKLKDSLELLNTDDDFIKWSAGLKDKFSKGKKIDFEANAMIMGHYRPFTKKYLQYQTDIIERPSRYKSIFGEDNQVIYVTGNGIDFSTLVTDKIPNLHFMNTGQGFYKKNNGSNENLFDDDFNIQADNKFDLSQEDTFYYVYAVLHSTEYLRKYINNLTKALPRIPKVRNKEKYVEIGKKLADLHLNYEDVPAYDGVNIIFKSDNPSFKVKKMKHPKRCQLDTIIFNEDIVITDIPERAYKYVVNGKPAIEWIIDQYQVKKDKKSGIVDDPNEFSDNPKYIFNLLLSIINVSMQTMDLVESLPSLEIID